MAKFLNGAIGTFSGKVGSIIGSSWRSVHYIRGLSKRRTKPFSERQMAQQQRFGMMGRFLLPLKGLVEIGLANEDESRSTLFNRAMSRNMHAVVGTYPDFNIDYSQVVFSKGSWLVPRNASVALSPGVVTVNWNPAVNAYSGDGDDEMYVLLYDHEQDLFYTSDTIEPRSSATVEIPLDDGMAGNSADVWAFAVSRDGKRISNTLHLGSFILE